MGDFELESVLYFIISKGGRVRNHELVTHFKNFLNHPVNKAENREKFKDYVNELASIKLDGGEKVLVLKKKYRPPTDDGDLQPPPLPSFPSYQPGPKSKPVTLKPVVSEPSFTEQHSSAASETPQLGTAFEDSRSAQNDFPRAHSEPPSVTTGNGEADLDNPDGLAMSKVRSDEAMEVKMRNTDRVPSSLKAAEGSISMASVTGSNASLASSKSAVSSSSGVASMDEDANSSVISVKDKIKKLNKNISETDLNAPKQGGPVGGGKKNKHFGGDDDDMTGSFVTLDAEQRDWMIISSCSDYHEMNRLLSKNPGLAKLQNFTNGYTALHWAAKFGKEKVIQLVANKPGVHVDQRSHGGYTALHLAAIHGQEHIIELLVQTYKADANLRDYSGRKAKQYLKNSASSKAQQLLASRRLGSDHSNVKVLDDSFIRATSSRMSNRAKAMSSLLQAKQPLLRSSWNGSSDDMFDEKEKHLKTPPGSAESSPGSFRKKSSKDASLMPPPTESASRRLHPPSRNKSSSREVSPAPGKNNSAAQNIPRSESYPGMTETSSTSTIV